MNKMQRAALLFRMGFIDTYDYIVGQHPGTPDDTISITVRVRAGMSRNV